MHSSSSTKEQTRFCRNDRKDKKSLYPTEKPEMSTAQDFLSCPVLFC